jgi:hypothetical protein
MVRAARASNRAVALSLARASLSAILATVGEENERPKSDAPPRWAADEPTAMWDEASLKKEGYEGLAEAPAEPAKGPATAPDVGGEDRRSVLAPETGTASANAAPGPVESGGLSWPATLAIATLVAIFVYFAVRMLR